MSTQSRLACHEFLNGLVSSPQTSLLLQELKCVEEAFPATEIGEVGYNVAVSGQKTYNGVAIVSKSPIQVERTALPGDNTDEQARYIEAMVGNVRVASIYLPNGNPTRDENGGNHEKFRYKLGWMDRLYNHVQDLLTFDDAIVFGGDYNIVPTDEDVYDPIAFADDALCRSESRKKFRAIVHLGSHRRLSGLQFEPHRYSYWDYKAGARQKDNGVLIDHLLPTPQAADRLVASGIDKTPRGSRKGLDHTPVWCELAD